MSEQAEMPRGSTSAVAQDQPDYPAHPKRSGQGFFMVILVIALFGALFIFGLLPRLRLAPKLAADAKTAKTAPTLVNIAYPVRSPAVTRLELPGDIEGADQTAISARASGYVRKWYVDIGDHVKAGQTLALIETPDTDQEVVQARAQVVGSAASAEQARANYLMQIANADQAVANVSKAQAAVEQARSDVAHSQVGEQQAQQQAEQQAAQVRSSKASLDQAQLTAERYESLAKQGAIDQQTADQDRAVYLTDKANYEALESALKASQTNVRAAHQTTLSSEANLKSMLDSVTAARAALTAAHANAKATLANVGAADATVASNKANLNRNAILQSFQKITAPFDGIITGRNAEVGSLVSATGGISAITGSDVSTGGTAGSATSTSLFSMVRTGTVRVFINVPQAYISAIRPGQTVQVSVGGLGSKVFTGRVNRDTSVLDATSRTLLTQVDVSNPNGVLRPGMFTTVNIDVPQSVSAWRIPDTALITDAEGTRVATVTADHKAHFQAVVVGRDYGKEMDVVSGVQGNETLIENAPAVLQEGMTVKEVAPQPTDKDKAEASGGKGKSREPGGSADASGTMAPGAPNAAPTAAPTGTQGADGGVPAGPAPSNSNSAPTANRAPGN